jgi:hypothetical protein
MDSKIKPDFLIIGAEKSGTTWVYRCLKRHKNIFMPEVKEIHYFNESNSKLEKNENYEKNGLGWYFDHFRRRAGEKRAGEATPMYLCDDKAPCRIKRTLPDVKLIASLRYPTDRAYSHYWMARGKGDVEITFREAVRTRDPRFIERGRYEEQIERYLSLFDRESLLLLIHEELFRNPSWHLNRTADFLEVDDTFYRNQSWLSTKVNRSSAARSEWINNLIESTAKWMRGREGLRQILDALKHTGITDKIKEANTRRRDYPSMAEDLRKELDDYYAPTVRYVEKKVGRCIDAWRERMSRNEPGTAQN